MSTVDFSLEGKVALITGGSKGIARSHPHEIAGIVLYWASPAGTCATGQTFVVDGGELVYAPLDNQ